MCTSTEMNPYVWLVIIPFILWIAFVIYNDITNPLPDEEYD